MTQALARMFSVARAGAFAALAVGAGALLAPAPAQAQYRYGYAGDGAFPDGRAYAPPRPADRAYAPRVSGYRPAAYRPPVRAAYHAPRPASRAAHRPVYRSSRNPWPVVAGVGLGVVAGAAIANSRPRYAQPAYYPQPQVANGYHANGYYTDARYAGAGYANAHGGQCWLEQRKVHAGFERRVMTVRVCPHY